MGKQSINRHLLIVFLCACGPPQDPPPGLEAASQITAEMVRLNQAGVSADSLATRRAELFDQHGTNEKEFRAWINQARSQEGKARQMAERVATLLEDETGVAATRHRASGINSGK